MGDVEVWCVVVIIGFVVFGIDIWYILGVDICVVCLDVEIGLDVW